MITIDGKTYRTLPEQVEANMKDIAKLETDNTNIQGNINELRNALNFTSQRLTETIEDVAELEGKVYDPISSATIIADKDAENKEVSFTLAADIAAKIDNSLQTPRSTLTDTILVGVDSTKSQCNVAIGDGLVIENDTLKATTPVHLYCHNITLNYRHTNTTLASAGSDGAYEATFTIINTDPNSYNFSHYPALADPTVMSADKAWQLYRLYTAMSIGHKRDLEPERPASGASIGVVNTNGSYSIEKAINSDIKTKYYNFTDLDEYKRLMVLNATYIAPASRALGGIAFEVSCGHATFDSNGVEQLWDNYTDWFNGEYNKATLTDPSVTYKTYYTYQRLTCFDSVEVLY